MLVLVLVPDAVQAYAPYMIGTLRSPGEPAFVAGHRGDRADAPENTMPAFEAAFAGGLEFVETDVQLTADGFAVLLHDETVDRTTDGTGAVAELTLAEVQALDAGSWFGPEFAGTRIPQLGEFLDLLATTPHTKALIELKELLDRRRDPPHPRRDLPARRAEPGRVRELPPRHDREPRGRGRRHPAHHHPARPARRPGRPRGASTARSPS